MGVTMKYEILNEQGEVINTIVATPEFVEARFPGGYREMPADPIALLKIQAEIIGATQQRLDDFARTRNYDGILSACTYATSTVPKFQAEGQYAVNARDMTWVTLYQILGEVQAGTRPVPSSFADIEPDLPVLTWPTQP